MNNENIGRDIHKSLLTFPVEASAAEQRFRDGNPEGYAFAKDFISAIDLEHVYEIYRTHLKGVEPASIERMNEIGPTSVRFALPSDMGRGGLEAGRSSIMSYQQSWNGIQVSWADSGLISLHREFEELRDNPTPEVWEQNVKTQMCDFLITFMHELGHAYEFQKNTIDGEGRYVNQQGFARERRALDAADQPRDYESMKEGWAELRALITTRELLSSRPFVFRDVRLSVENFDAFMPRLVQRPYYPEGLLMVWNSIDAIARDAGVPREVVEKGFLRASLTESGADYLNGVLGEVFGPERAEEMRVHERTPGEESAAKRALTYAHLQRHPELHEEWKHFLARYAP